MSETRRAVQIISRAETELRSLLRECVESSSYREIQQLAFCAERLSRLRIDLQGDQAALSERIEGGNSAVAEPGPIKRSDGRGPKRKRTRLIATGKGANGREPDRAQSYPRFEREDDKLVKIGWSEKEAREYEHRAPRESVFRVIEAIESHAAARERPFTVDDLRPPQETEPEPSYQTYLTLAWLRSEGYVDRDGKNTYRLISKTLREDSLEAWNGLPDKLERSARL